MTFPSTHKGCRTHYLFRRGLGAGSLMGESRGGSRSWAKRASMLSSFSGQGSQRVPQVVGSGGGGGVWPLGSQGGSSRGHGLRVLGGGLGGRFRGVRRHGIRRAATAAGGAWCEGGQGKVPVGGDGRTETGGGIAERPRDSGNVPSGIAKPTGGIEGGIAERPRQRGESRSGELSDPRPWTG